MMGSNILRVRRTKAQAKEAYDRISRFYDYLAGVFEKKYRDRTLELLEIKRGEVVLEIGFGTGHCLKRIAEVGGRGGQGLRHRHLLRDAGGQQAEA
ncbi:hypothetical protein [Candidatus Pyrohabitans sp.]